MTEPFKTIARVEDFRQRAEAEAWEEPVRIVLPKSGLAVVVRRPRPLAYTLVAHPVAYCLAAQIAEAGSVETAGLTAEDRRALAMAAEEVFCAAIVEPKFALEPGPDAIDPRWVPPEDRLFLTRYIGGEVAADGRNLAPFSPERDAAGSSASGSEIPPAAV